MKPTHKKIVAIDPGYDRCGIAVMLGGPTPTLISSECVRTDKKESHEKRLGHIFQSVRSVLERERPALVAIETLFFSLNKKTAIKVAEARGAALSAAGAAGIPVLELSPQTIKLSITGNGGAEKSAVQKMVGIILKREVAHLIDDEIDAIAIALTAVAQMQRSF